MDNRPTFKNIHKVPMADAIQEISKFCNVCFQTFENDAKLTDHVEEFHQNEFKCDLCPNQPVTFTTETAKVQHDELFHTEYISTTMKDVYREGFFDMTTPYYEAWSKKKRKLHPLCLMCLPENKRQKLKQDMSDSDSEESEESESEITAEESESEESGES